MSTYEYIVEVNDKASGFINQFTKTLDKVNERFGSNRISGTEAFESLTAPLDKVSQIVGNLGGGLSSMFSFGPEGEAASASTGALEQSLGGLESKVNQAFDKFQSFSNSLMGSSNEGVKAESTFEGMSGVLAKLGIDTGNSGKMLDGLETKVISGKDAILSFADQVINKVPGALNSVSGAVDIAKDKFLEIGSTIGTMPVGDALATVMSGAGDVMKGVLPEAMNEEWLRISEGIQTNLVPAFNTFSEMTGITLDSISPKIAEMATGFGMFLGENGPAIQEFIGQGQQMVGFVSRARDTISQVSGKWTKYKGLLTKTNILAKVSAVRAKAQSVATLAFSAATGKLNIATKLMAVGQRILNTVLKSNPIILIISLLLAGGAAILAFARKSNKASEATKKMNEMHEKTNEVLAKGEELRKRVNNVDNLNTRQKDDLRSDLQNRQKELEDLKAANQVELNSFDLKAKKESLENGSLSRSERRSVKEEIDNYEKLKLADSKVAEALKQNAAQQKVVSASIAGPAGAAAAAEGEGGMTELQDGATDIAGGGKKATNINISLEKMIETLEVHAETLDEGLSDVETKVKEVFLRILNSGNYAAQ
ncbi:MAG: hypothetical protein HEP71_00645 [Roseivirga sp.]|nr:hypothetical protein [Roseivirga sp.]